MNDLLERYLGAVCSYFTEPKKEAVYNDLKNQIKTSAKHYDDLEDLILQYGHPRSVALSYGYRPYIHHIYNPKVRTKIEKYLFIVCFLFLIISTLFSLHEMNCLPFFPSHRIIDHSGRFIPWILSHPMIVIIIFMIIALVALVAFDFKNPVPQTYDLEWNEESLKKLPHPSHYPSHFVESILMALFVIYFVSYFAYGNTSVIVDTHPLVKQIIYDISYFFQPFVMMIILDYAVDLTKKIYTRKYLVYSSMTNLFIICSIVFFVMNSQYLKDYLLPIDTFNAYIFINVLIIGALCTITFISLYKLTRNFKFYRCLFKK